MKHFKKSIIGLIGLTLILLSSCQKEPSASFTVSKTSATVNESISFTNTSIDGDSYEWDFGDGQTSSSENPSHSYNSAGSYSVTLTVYSKNGKKDDKASATIIVTAADPCDGVTCYNGGTCINGTCSCPQGYTGPACESQVTPTKIRISKVKITKFPQYDGGSNWDIWDGPDIYVVIKKGSTLIHEQPTMFEDASVTSTYTYTPTSYIDLTDATAQYSISLYDYDDGLGDDFMGGISFYPYSSTGGFPTTLYLDAGAGVTFELTVSYVW